MDAIPLQPERTEQPDRIDRDEPQILVKMYHLIRKNRSRRIFVTVLRISTVLSCMSMFPADANERRVTVEILIPARQLAMIPQETVMKTARWFVLAICVLGPQFAYGQYDDGVPPVFLPETGTSKSVSRMKSDNLVSTSPALSRMLKNGKVGEEVASSGCGCGCESHGGCNELGFVGDSNGGPCQGNCRVGRSFFRRGGCDSGCNSGSGRIRFSVNRGPQVCDQCGQDNRTFLQRVLPISISMRSNHESRYTGFFGGYHDMQDIRAVDRLLDFDESFILGITRGRRFCGNIRLESEFAIRNAPAANYFEGAFMGEDFIPTATYDATDGFFALSSMRNVLYDFNGLGTRLKPYVGLGLGGVAVTGDFINDTIGRADWINDTAFAYQFIIGATRKLNNRSEAYAEFRHFGTSGLELENDAGDPTTDFAFQNNTVVFGLRINRPRCCGN